MRFLKFPHSLIFEFANLLILHYLCPLIITFYNGRTYFRTQEQDIEVLNLEEVTPEDIDENEPLFGTGLALDSIDALELIVLLDKNYGIRLDDPKKGKEIFQSVKTMADYITAHRTK